MNRYLSIDEDELKARGSYWTAREICQQPDAWRELIAVLEGRKEALDARLAPLLGDADTRILLSGAGSSGLIGDILAPWLRRRLRRRVDAVSTTDLVAAPHFHLAEDLPTLMVSFARSGDSPESVASVDLASQLLTECHHQVISCNPRGRLAARAAGDATMDCLLMPARTDDRSLAMTSGFTTMLAAGAALFAPVTEQLQSAAKIARGILDRSAEETARVATGNFSRFVVLGAGCLHGAAREAALKMLELTAGKVLSISDTPLGFRHGPKSMVDSRTLVLPIQSTQAYSRAYDADLINELKADGRASMVLEVSAERLGFDASGLDDIALCLPYIVYCQMLAFYKALHLDVACDNPCPAGEINRVVKGVTIYPFDGKVNG